MGPRCFLAPWRHAAKARSGGKLDGYSSFVICLPRASKASLRGYLLFVKAGYSILDTREKDSSTLILLAYASQASRGGQNDTGRRALNDI